MKKKSLLLFLFIFTQINAQIPSGYYDATVGLSGYELKSALHEIISKNHNWNYDDLPEYYEQTDLDVYYDHDPSNNPSDGMYILLDIYSEIPTGADDYEYYSTELIGNTNAEGNGYNREHMVPQSTFSIGSLSNYPMYSDLFHVIPADARINQLRSNFPYGVCGNTVYYTFSNSSKICNDATPELAYNGRVYEPIDEFKGDVARSLLYFAVRYEGKFAQFNHGGDTPPETDRSQFDGTEERAFEPAYIEMLKNWHVLDPVSQREIDRNNKVYEIQKNRNPFIDHPEWVALIWDITTDDIPPSAPTDLNSPQQFAHFVNLSWNASPEPDVLGYKIYLNGEETPIISTKATHISIDHLTPGTIYNFTVKAYDKGYLESENSNDISVTTLETDEFAKDLIITKYLEGSGNNKAIEITNKTGHEVNLNRYHLNIQFYSTTNETYYYGDSFQLEGKLDAEETIVVIHPNANFSCYEVSQAQFVTAAPPLNFSGIQYVELAYNGYTTVDAIGVKDMDNSLENVSLYRLETINQPTDVFDITQWEQHEMDYCAGLGGTMETSELEDVYTKFRIYPVPARDELFIAGEEFEKIKSLNIMDLNGRKMIELKNPFQTQNKLDISNLNTGIYILQLDDETHHFIKK
ncbi:endonuclease [Moheibacter lacus]|uniref:Endonuclease n=1 Tax=Moheibacter lacus TaxID=2745851 RepID=A0A838ZEM0_9FLAO|nr:endonuclease [Moheibacter lacus]MBA5628191.1 endonuclease [Moheibacter lacus]